MWHVLFLNPSRYFCLKRDFSLHKRNTAPKYTLQRKQMMLNTKNPVFFNAKLKISYQQLLIIHSLLDTFSEK